MSLDLICSLRVNVNLTRKNMAKKKTPSKKATVKLTEDQKKQLAAVFGEDVAKRLQHIQVEKIAEYLKAELRLN